MAGPVKGTIGNEEAVLNDAPIPNYNQNYWSQCKKVELAVVAQAEAVQRSAEKSYGYGSATGKTAKSLKNLKKL